MFYHRPDALPVTQSADIKVLMRTITQTNLSEFQTGIFRHHREWMKFRQHGCRAKRWNRAAAFHWGSHLRNCSSRDSHPSWQSNDDAMTSQYHLASATNHFLHFPTKTVKIDSRKDRLNSPTHKHTPMLMGPWHIPIYTSIAISSGDVKFVFFSIQTSTTKICIKFELCL